MTSAPRTKETAQTPMFGWRIRALRRRKGLTLQALADQAGISVGFLSQVERDLATPSLGTLASLASALDITLDWFIAAARPADSVTRAADRKRFSVAESSLQYEQVSTTLPGGTLTSFIIHLPAGYASEVVAHNGEELIIVLDGVVRQSLGEGSFILSTGDTMHFMGDTPHAFANVGEGPARLLWTGTAPRMLGRAQGGLSVVQSSRKGKTGKDSVIAHTVS
jgi:transcriptional regulator with XRE-family HTH domain